MLRRLSLACAAVFFAHCSSIEIKNRYDHCEKITVGPGVEDFALIGDTLYVSSHDRRGWKVPGDIFTVNIKSRQVKKLPRSGEGTGLFFAPHGIDTFRTGKDSFLYVVNHGAEMNDADQSVLIYRMQGDMLEFVTQIKDELINSPNDLAVTDTGSFYVTNDHGSRGSLWEVFWGLKKSKVVYCTLNSMTANTGAVCRTAAEGIAMANGILVRDNKVYVAATRESKVYEFTRGTDGTLVDKQLIAEVPGPDNLFWHEQALLTASHTANWKFFRHTSKQENIAPSYVVSVNPKQKSATGLYFDTGAEISAASGAFVHNGKLYISQVFGDFVLECRPVK
jgi:arylesterase/paraoxonase